MKNKKNQRGFVLWFTGLPQSGKSTIANNVYKILKKKGTKVERLDGDIIRKSISSDLGFTRKDRNKNIKRAIFITQILSKNDICVIASFISPYQKMRNGIRKKVTNFIEVFVNTPLSICEERDTRGLYKKAREGKIKNFTGISDPYEKPKNPEIELHTHIFSIKENATAVMRYLLKNGFI